MNWGILVFIGLVTVMWLLAGAGMYLRGQLDALHWIQAMQKWVDDRGTYPMPKHRTGWSDIAFYIVPMVILSGLLVSLVITGGK